jgi:histidyl-tRNA synthetase
MKPSIPKGTRDFSPTEIANRNYIFNTIKAAFETFGFQPIETPSFENSSTLMGKYGEEGDRLIFKILNSGDYLNKADEKLLSEKDSTKLTSQISEKALRYDLTVPFARYVVQHQNEITFPFKRYQIQPVWRADRPQKGRFREFYQCDADVVGSASLWQEVEFIQLYDTVFSKLNLRGATIKINNRKILSGIAEVIGAKDKLIDFTVALDKLDKIGKDGVVKEMISKGITENAIEKVSPLFDFSGSNQDKISSLEAMLQTSEEGIKGVEELRFVCNSIEELGLQSAIVEVDVTLARGLNYYTGAIFEVAVPKEVKMGSIGGGGRYDDLTGVFGLPDVSGVGISFGLDRIYLVLEELGLFKTVELPKPKVIFLNFDATTDLLKMKAIAELRKNNIKSEFYPDLGESNKQQKRQWKYVTNRALEFVVSKVEKDVFTLKNMNSGEQTTCSLSELVDKLKA